MELMRTVASIYLARRQAGSGEDAAWRAAQAALMTLRPDLDGAAALEMKGEIVAWASRRPTDWLN
jgi:hypothetical protein